jgi:hypothetical protein
MPKQQAERMTTPFNGHDIKSCAEVVHKSLETVFTEYASRWWCPYFGKRRAKKRYEGLGKLEALALPDVIKAPGF